MARDVISVILPEVEASQSVATETVTAKTVTVANGIQIKEAAKNKNNSLAIVIQNTAETASSVTFAAGDTYPNSMLGDLDIPVDASTTIVCQIQDLSRFENRDGSINIDFAAGFTGNIYAVAKRAGVAPVE